jgi:glycosyltransferase involved in cell wall biosynthesis
MGPLPGDVHKTVLIHTHATPTRSNGTGPDLHGTDVAIVHDYLNQRGGAERVVLEMSDIWPQAPIYTSLYRADSTFPGFHGRDVRTTLLDRLPIDRGFRNLFPLYPAAFRALGEIAADVVISSSSGWSHMARSVPDALHVVYCYTPARWLYRHDHLATAHERSFQRALARPSLRSLRGIDCRAAHRADLYIAISQAVQRRIKHVYGIDAALVHPPVDIDRFHPTPRGERLLVVSRLLPYKRVGLIVEAATQMGIGLDVVGDGPLLPALRAAAGPSVEFHGAVGDRAVAELMQGGGGAGVRKAGCRLCRRRCAGDSGGGAHRRVLQTAHHDGPDRGDHGGGAHRYVPGAGRRAGTAVLTRDVPEQADGRDRCGAESSVRCWAPLWIFSFRGGATPQRGRAAVIVLDSASQFTGATVRYSRPDRIVGESPSLRCRRLSSEPTGDHPGAMSREIMRDV